MALPDPVTRKEMYLNKAATGSGRIPPEPVTREEMYLEAIAEGGGGGGNNDLLVVKVTSDGATTYTFSHTPAEVYSWITANKPAIAIMNGVIGKVYLGDTTNVICAIPRFRSLVAGSDQLPWSEGITFSGQYNGVEWGINPYLRIFGADEVLSDDISRDDRALIYSTDDDMPLYQTINKCYAFDGALYQLVGGAMSAANPEAALSTVFDSTAPEFGDLIQIIGRIYDSFGGRYRGIMLQGIADQDNRDVWLVKNVTRSDRRTDITADACFTTFSNSSPSSVSMITLAIAELRNASQEPEKVAVTAICKTINTTIV